MSIPSRCPYPGGDIIFNSLPLVVSPRLQLTICYKVPLSQSSSFSSLSSFSHFPLPPLHLPILPSYPTSDDTFIHPSPCLVIFPCSPILSPSLYIVFVSAHSYHGYTIPFLCGTLFPACLLALSVRAVCSMGRDLRLRPRKGRSDAIKHAHIHNATVSTEDDATDNDLFYFYLGDMCVYVIVYVCSLGALILVYMCVPTELQPCISNAS